MPRTPAAAFSVVPVAPTSRRLKPPNSIGEGARAEFLRIVMAERVDHFRPSDLSLLCQYCEASALAERAIKEAMLESPPNQLWLAAWREATRTMKDLALRLRL